MSPPSPSTRASEHASDAPRLDVPLPPCGLYRTTRALEGGDGALTAGALVNLHNHSASGDPVVLVPAFNVFNRWQWKAQPIVVRSLSWLRTLRRLPTEGFYVLREEIPFDEGAGKWPKGALVQLGYDRAGRAIVFIAQLRYASTENALWFAERGQPLSDAQLEELEPVEVHEEPDAIVGGAEKK